MKIKEVLSESISIDKVKDAVWYHWQEDALLPAGVDYPEQLSDDDFMDFEEHVRDVYAYAHKHHISNAFLAVEKYSDSISL